MAPCTSQIVLNTAWHKTTKQSSVGVVFQMDPTVYVTTATAGQITMDNTLVTGSNGAWGKTDKIHAVMLEPIAGSNNENYELTLTYKVSHVRENDSAIYYIYSTSTRLKPSNRPLHSTQGRGWNPTA